MTEPPGARTISEVAGSDTGMLRAFGLEKRKSGWTSTAFWLTVATVAVGGWLSSVGKDAFLTVTTLAVTTYIGGGAVMKIKGAA